MKFAYYPGCSAKGSSADYERSTQALCQALGIQLEEIAGWNCCGSTPAHAVSTELSAALCARNLDIGAKSGVDRLVTPCPSCMSNHKAARKHMENAEFRDKVNSLLDTPCHEQLPDMTSVLQAIAEVVPLSEITRRVARPLKGLTFAAYYGCLMSRPKDLVQFGDPENPMLMEDMLTACGATMVDFPLKTACCGAAFGIPERPLTARNSGRILELATRLSCDAIVVCCPLCQMNLDLRQDQASRAYKRTFSMPVLYYTQLLGLALGLQPSELGLEKLVVSCGAILTKLNVAKNA